MEHSRANIDALKSDHVEADSRILAHVSHAMELYSSGGVVTWNIVKLTLMYLDLTIMKQIRECLSIFHMPWNYIHQDYLLYGT